MLSFAMPTQIKVLTTTPAEAVKPSQRFKRRVVEFLQRLAEGTLDHILVQVVHYSPNSRFTIMETVGILWSRMALKIATCGLHTNTNTHTTTYPHEDATHPQNTAHQPRLRTNANSYVI